VKYIDPDGREVNAVVQANNNMYQGTYSLDGANGNFTIYVANTTKADKVDVSIIIDEVVKTSEIIEFHPLAMSGSITLTVDISTDELASTYDLNASGGGGMWISYPKGSTVDTVVVDATIILPNQDNATTQLHLTVEF
jgi:hypothetical protein